jgi:hypothetical protein
VSSRILMVTLLVALTQAGAAWAEDPSRPLAAGVQQAGAQNQAAQSAPAGAQGAEKAPQAQDSGWKVEFAPIYLWAPFNISTVTLPQFPELPAPPPGSNDGGRPTGKTGASLNGAAMAAIRIEKSRWMLRGNAVWAGLSGERELPRMKLSGDLIYGEAQTGFRVVRGLWVEGGVRRLAVDVDAEVLDYPKVSRKPGVWDPIVGATYRLPMGSHWLLTLHGDGGGFGVGSQVDSNVYATLDWRMARHFGLTLGYSLLYFRIEDSLVDSTRLEKKLNFGTTLHGPIIGFKLLF